MNNKPAIDVIVTGGEITNEETQAYVERMQNRVVSRGRYLASLRINLDGEFVELTPTWGSIPFERIRRITGYLSLTTKFNPGKVAEEKDRVKHNDNGG